MGHGQSTASGTKVLAKVAQGDARAAQQVEDAKAGYFRSSKGRRAALAVAADRGNCQLLVSVYEAAEQAKGSWQTRQDLLNSPVSHGQTLLMKTCSKGHLDCVTYLLSKGADVMATNTKGETCLHIAAKHAHTSCLVRLLSSRINTASNTATRLADLTLREELQEVKYIDLHNLAGMTALHVATLNGSAPTVQAILAHGGSVDAQIRGNNLTPWLSRGSTALHIAAARGFHAVVDALLAAQTPDSGIDLRRVRNHRGLKPFQLARLNGHTSIARQLGDPRMRRARGAGRRRGEGTPAADGQSAPSPETLLTMLIQRAKLLLTLKAMSVSPAKATPAGISLMAICTHDQAQEAKVEAAAADVLQCSDAWRKSAASGKPAGSILRLLAALDDLPAAAALNEAHLLEGSPDKGRSGSSYAAAAMVQSALNAMASSASADPVEASSATLTPTTPLAAAVILQAALRSLSGSKRRGSSRRARPGSALTHDNPMGNSSSLPNSPHAQRSTSDSQRPLNLSNAPATPARAQDQGPAHSSYGNIRSSSFQSQSHSRSNQHHQSNPPTPRTPTPPRAATPHTPRDSTGHMLHHPFQQEKAQEVQEQDAFGGNQRQRWDLMSQVQPESVPATPELPQHAGGMEDGPASGGNSNWHQFGGSLEGRQSGGNIEIHEAAQSSLQTDIAAQRKALQQAAVVQRSSSMKRLHLPSAEAIDALCDMDLPPGSPIPVERLKLLPPIATRSNTHAYESSGQLASSSGTQTSGMPESYIPQHSMHLKLGRGNQSRQYDAPESSLNAGSSRLQSECGSSAYDEGNSSGLVHSVSHEERIMQDLLEEGNDDISSNNYDAPSADDVDAGNDNSKVLNTRELQGILGQHGYKLPGARRPQTEDGGSDGDADGDDEEEEADEDDSDGDLDPSGAFARAADHAFQQDAVARRKALSDEDEGLCSICMDRPLEAQIAGCEHQMCLQCAYQMCARGLSSPLCPFCRGPINTFKPVGLQKHH